MGEVGQPLNKPMVQRLLSNVSMTFTLDPNADASFVDFSKSLSNFKIQITTWNN